VQRLAIVLKIGFQPGHKSQERCKPEQVFRIAELTAAKVLPYTRRLQESAYGKKPFGQSSKPTGMVRPHKAEPRAVAGFS
jgi:hypothetical protein